jgi:hypothetical protein
MGGRLPHSVPSWARNVGTLMLAVQAGEKVQVYCRGCRSHRPLTVDDLQRIEAAKGMRFSMTNRRTRCRLTRGCDGWNVFRYQRGPWVYPLYSEEQDERWSEQDRAADELARRMIAELLLDAKHDRDRKRAVRR